MDRRAQLEANLREIDQRIAAVCSRAVRPRSEVTLVAVTKTVPPEIAGWLPELGVNNLAESRPQSLWAKAAALPTTVRWHQIGHLQRNKLARTLPQVALTHSVDSVRLLHAIEEDCARRGAPADVLLEFNLSREDAKGGFPSAGLAEIAERLQQLRHTRVCGLMTMAALSDDAEASRPVFAELRSLRQQLRERAGSPHSLEHLSMGMSQDFEVAIEEGATLVRIGSALFEGVS